MSNCVYREKRHVLLTTRHEASIFTTWLRRRYATMCHTAQLLAHFCAMTHSSHFT